MSLLWEPIRETARERGWSFVAKEFFTLLMCFAVAAAWVVILAGFPVKVIAALWRGL